MHTLFRQIFGQVPDELGIAFAGFVQLGIFTQGLVVSRQRHRLCLLHLKPVHCHLGSGVGGGGMDRGLNFTI